MDILTPIDGFDDHPLSRLTLAHMMLFVIHVKLGVFFFESLLWLDYPIINDPEIKLEAEVDMTVTPSPSALRDWWWLMVQLQGVISQPSTFDSAKRASRFAGQCWPSIGELRNQEKCHNQLAHQGQKLKTKLGNWVMSWLSVLFSRRLLISCMGPWQEFFELFLRTCDAQIPQIPQTLDQQGSAGHP